MNHTPGPWKINEHRDDHWEIISDQEPLGIAELNYIGGNAEANAHLIAAAPDLLGACKKLRTALIETYDMTDNELKALEMAEQAIAKAEGRNEE